MQKEIELKQKITLKQIKSNLGWIKRKAELHEIRFKEEVENLNNIVKNSGAKPINLDMNIRHICALYNNYHALLASAAIIEGKML